MLVTGGSKGVGAALAAELAARGARVTLAARPSGQLDEVAGTSGATAMPVDLADFDALDGYVARAEAVNGPLDVLVNNAALVTSGPVSGLARDDLRRQIAANLLAPMELCRQALPGMIERGEGSIANVSSMVAELGIPNLPAYVSAKAGLTKFTLDLHRDLKRAKVPVHTLLVVLGEVPGTQINAGFREDRAVAALADKFARLPVLTPELVGRRVADALARRRRTVLVMPRYNAPIFHLRQLPIRPTQPRSS